MTKFNLTKTELNDMVKAMDAADFGPEIEIEIEDATQTKPKWDYSGSFDLQPPDGYESDEDSLGELSTNDSMDEYEDDGQPTEYDEWQDLYGGDDSIYEHDCDCMFDN